MTHVEMITADISGDSLAVNEPRAIIKSNDFHGEQPLLLMSF